MKIGNKYPVNTLAEMALIPAAARPRFLAELPDMLETMTQITEAAECIEERTNFPWIIRKLTSKLRRTEVIRKSMMRGKMTWIDDEKGEATVNIRLSEGGAIIFSQTEKMEPTP